jgi:PAS domain S-box-containing protein
VVDDVSERRQAERTLQYFSQELKRQVDEKTETLSSVNRLLGQQLKQHLRDKSLLRSAQERYACLVESTLIGIYLVQHDRIRFANRRFAAMFGYSGPELEGRDIRSLLSFGGFPESPEGHGAGDPAEGIIFHEQVVRGLCKDGNQLWLQMSNAPIRWHDENMILGNLMDITAQVEGELDLRESEREQQRLSAELVSAQEAERLRIASELHDGIGQILSVIKLGIENLAKGLDGELVQRHERNFKSLISMTRHATEEVRRISMDLHPAMLEDLGLVSTIDWFCREYRKVSPQIEIAKRIKFDEQELDPEQRIAAFRILQEAFNNIGKHAGAKRIDLALRRGKGSIKLTIKDDGAGFVTDRSNASEPGFGLRSMKQRAQLTGGRLSVKSRPGRGTIIRAEWPLRDAP